MTDKRLFLWIITLLLCALPLPLFVSNIFYISLIAFTIYYVYKNNVKPKFGIGTIVFVLFYSFMAFSYLWSIDKSLTVIGLGRKSVFLILPILFAFTPKLNSEDVKLVFRYFTYAFVTYALFFISMGIAYFLSNGSMSNLTHHELVSPLNLNRVYVSLFTIVAVFHVIWNEKNNLINNLILITLFIFLLLLSSKTIILTSFLIIIIFRFQEKISVFKTKNLYLAVLISITSFGLFKYHSEFYSEMIPTKYREVIAEKDFGKSYYFNGSELRILYSRFLLEFLNEENILFTGFGLNASQQKINEKCVQYRVPDGYGTEYNFHNQYNQLFAELGIFGVLMLLSILSLGFRKSLLNRDRFSFAIFTIFTSLFFTESVFNRQRGIYFFVLVFLLLISTNEENNYSEINTQNL